MKKKFIFTFRTAGESCNVQVFRAFALAAACMFLIAGIYSLPIGQDWAGFRTASLEMVAGRSPYIPGIFNPPWVLAALIPLAVLPFRLGGAILSFLNIAVVGIAIYKISPKPYSALLLLTPPIIRQILDPNVDWMVAASLLVPPQVGLFFALAKPQIGAPLVLFWLIESYRQGGIREVIRVFAPVTIVTLLSFAFYGFWPAFASSLTEVPHNVSMWPVGIPFGLALLVYALKIRSPKYSLLSAPMLAPYFGYYSLHITFLGLLENKWETIAAIVGLWVMFLVPSHLIR